MVWLAGLVGFIGGFVVALVILNHLLRGVDRQELLTNKSLRLKYGLIAWGIALVGALCAVTMAKIYFPEI